MPTNIKVNPLCQRISDVIQNFEEQGIQEETEENYIFETKKTNIYISLKPKKKSQIEKSIPKILNDNSITSLQSTYDSFDNRSLNNLSNEFISNLKNSKNMNIKDKYIQNTFAKIKTLDLEEEKKETIFVKPKGLQNLGLSCYMNSLLQCLYYVKDFREYFIEHKTEFDDDKPTCKAFAEVMYGLKNDVKDCFVPNEFKKLMGSKNSLFLGCKAGDVKDLFFNLIDALLTELTIENENTDDESGSLNYSDKLQLFKESEKEIKQNYNIVNQIFIGYYYAMYNCFDSKLSTYSFQTETFIIFDLDKIKKYFNTDKLNIDLCLKYYYRKQPNSSFFCNECQKTHLGDGYEKIYRPPKILVLILDRGHGKTFRGDVEITKELELKDYINEENFEKEYSSSYKLICVSTHSGSSSSSGHYTARCLADNNKFYYFSDSYVQEIKDDNELFTNEPYLLFYQQNEIPKKEDNNENNLKIFNYNYNYLGFVRNKEYEIDNHVFVNYIGNEPLIDPKPKNKKIHYRNIVNEKKNIKKDKKSNDARHTLGIKYKEIEETLHEFINDTTRNYTVDYYYPNHKNYRIWKLTICGPKNTPYEGGCFTFKINIKKDIKKLSEIVKLENRIYHLNFGEKRGMLLFDIKYNNRISFYENILNLFDKIYGLFSEPNCEISEKHVNAKEKIQLYKANNEEYNKKAKESVLNLFQNQKN